MTKWEEYVRACVRLRVRIRACYAVAWLAAWWNAACAVQVRADARAEVLIGGRYLRVLGSTAQVPEGTSEYWRRYERTRTRSDVLLFARDMATDVRAIRWLWQTLRRTDSGPSRNGGRGG